MDTVENAHARSQGRRSREEAREEILDVAEQLMREHSVQAITVAVLMDRASIGRSGFYSYFRDRYDAVAGVLERLEAEMGEGAGPWLPSAGPSDPVAEVRSALGRTVALWAAHGPVLRTIAEAAEYDERVAAAYRGGLLERLIAAVAQRIEEAQSRGWIPPGDARETATALVLMNERYLADRMGRLPQADPDKVLDTLSRIWTVVLCAPVS